MPGSVGGLVRDPGEIIFSEYVYAADAPNVEAMNDAARFALDALPTAGAR
jgi:hypothetical protein